MTLMKCGKNKVLVEDEGEDLRECSNRWRSKFWNDHETHQQYNALKSPNHGNVFIKFYMQRVQSSMSLKEDLM